MLKYLVLWEAMSSLPSLQRAFTDCNVASAVCERMCIVRYLHRHMKCCGMDNSPCWQLLLADYA